MIAKKMSHPGKMLHDFTTCSGESPQVGVEKESPVSEPQAMSMAFSTCLAGERLILNALGLR